MNDLCTRPIFGRVQRSFFCGDVIAIVRGYDMYYVYSCPAHAHLPARRVESGDETTLCMSNEHAEIYESQSICMTINEHAACALCSGEVDYL